MLAAIDDAARDHQTRLIKTDNKGRPGVLALPASQAAADQAAEQPFTVAVSSSTRIGFVVSLVIPTGRPPA